MSSADDGNMECWLAKVPFPEISPILGSEEIWAYRNKMEYTFSDKMWLTREQLDSQEEFADRRAAGFHIPGAFDKVLDIEECHLQARILQHTIWKSIGTTSSNGVNCKH